MTAGGVPAVGEPNESYELRCGQWAARVRRQGAELVSLTAGDLGEVIWQGTSTAWSSRAPWLFPIIGRLPEGNIVYRDVPYTMPPHGFARDHGFELIASSEQRLRLRLESGAATLQRFPYRFQLDIEFRIERDRLELEVTVENGDAVPLPYDLGWHPTFGWPLTGQIGDPSLFVEGVDGLIVHRVRAAVLDGRDQAEVHAGSVLPLSAERLADGALVLLDLDPPIYAYGCEGGPRLIFETSGFPNLGIWRAPETQSVCIEPWCGHPATMNGYAARHRKPGSRLLAPAEKARHSIILRVA